MDDLRPLDAMASRLSKRVEHQASEGSVDEPSILYIVPRFPVASQTFVVNEWAKLESQFQMKMASLFRGKGGPVHPLAERVLPRVRFARALAIETAKANVRVFRRSPGHYVRILAIVGRKSFRRPAGGTLKGVLVFWKATCLAEFVEELNIKHVHAQLLHHPATAAWVISQFTGTPFSITAHADDLFLGPGLFQEKMRDATFVVTISDYNQEYIRKRAERLRRLEVIHCGVDIHEFSFRSRKECRTLVCVARLEPKKGHVTLLAAFAKMAAAHPELSLKIVGDGQERKALENLTRTLDISERVEFTGAVRSDGVREALDSADAFILPARATRRPSLRAGYLDGIPVSLMEAMASGLPVIAANVSGIPELVIDEATGLLVPPEDPAALAFAIQRLIEDDVLRARLACRARELVERDFNADVQAVRLGTLFAEVMKAIPSEVIA
jgi:glycosyltransferase involved in cell wall biosynthesis